MNGTAAHTLRESSAGARACSPDRTAARRLTAAAGACAGAVALAAYFFRLSGAVAVNPADAAGLLLMGRDAARGNWLLHGWRLASDSLWLTDVVVYAAGVAARGLDPILLRAVPAVMTLALVGAAAAAATAGRPRRVVSAVAVLSVLPILFPSRVMLDVLMGPFHTSAVVAALVALVALHHAREEFDRPRRRWTFTALAFLVLVAGTLSDPYTAVLGIAPAALVSLIRVFASPRAEEQRRDVWSLCAVVAAWCGVAAGAGLARSLGGAAIIPYQAATVAYAKIGAGIANLILALVQLGGADIFGRFIDRGMVPAVVRLAYLVAAFAATALVLREEIRRLRTRAPGEWLTAVLAASAALCLAGNLLCSADVNARYRFPLLIIAGVVLARRLGTLPFPWIERRKLLAGAVGIALLLAFSGPLGPYLDPTAGAPDPYARLGRWLAARGLTDGFGGYWEASIVTVASRGAVRVRPVASTKVYQPGLGSSGLPPRRWRLTPTTFGSKAAWYAVRPARFFLVFDPALPWDRDTGVTADVAARTFGPPDHAYQTGRFTVLVWDAGGRILERRDGLVVVRR